MKALPLIIPLLLPLAAQADDWHVGLGIGEAYYARTEDDVWYENGHFNVRTFHNYAITADVEKQVYDNLRVSVGVFAPQPQYVHANVISDNAYFAGQGGAEGTLLTTTKTVGVYAIASPEYRGFHVNLGLWLFRQSVMATAWGPNGQPATVLGWPSGGVGSVGYAIDPVYGFGYRSGANSIDVDFFIVSTGPGNSIGKCLNCQSGPKSMLPPGMDGKIAVAMFKHTF